MMPNPKELMKCRRDAADAMQKLIFRAHKNNGFVRPEDCQAVTDMILMSVIQSFAEYTANFSEEECNEHTAH